MVVVDASLLAAYLLREPEGKKFDPVLDQTAKGEVCLHVPALLEFEMLNILVMAERRGRITRQRRESYLGEWALIPLSRDAAPTPSVRLRIEALARKHRLSAYDAAYLELADRLDARLLTLDADLLNLRRTDRRIE